MRDQLTLELQLRRLPGVVGVGFHDDDDVVIVQVLTDEENIAHRSELRRQVTTRVRGHLGDRSEQSIVLEFEVVPRAGTIVHERVQLLGVTANEAAGEVEVQLAHAEQRVVGRSAGVSSSAAANATVVALRHLGTDVPFRLDLVDGTYAGGSVVVLARTGHASERRYGLADGASPLDAASRATLHALNRYLEGNDAWRH